MMSCPSAQFSLPISRKIPQIWQTNFLYDEKLFVGHEGTTFLDMSEINHCVIVLCVEITESSVIPQQQKY